MRDFFIYSNGFAALLVVCAAAEAIASGMAGASVIVVVSGHPLDSVYILHHIYVRPVTPI